MGERFILSCLIFITLGITFEVISWIGPILAKSDQNIIIPIIFTLTIAIQSFVKDEHIKL